MFVSYLLPLLTLFECQLKVFLPHRISFSFPDWSRAVGDEKGLKLYNFTILAAGVEPNKFLILISSHNGAIMGLFIELKTEFKLAQVISMQFRKKITVGCCEERQNSPSE